MKFQEILKCPSCKDENFTAKNNSMKCEKCHFYFPMINDIPWLFENNELSQNIWRIKCIKFLENINLEVDKLKHQINKVDILELTKERLNKNLQDQIQNLEQSKRIINLFFSNITSSNTSTLLIDSITNQWSTELGIQSYWDLIFRDWVWGEKEIINLLDVSFNKQEKLINNSQSLWIFGSGAGRIGYEIANRFTKIEIHQFEINPFLLYLSKEICNGITFELCEFPINPVHSNQQSIHQKLKSNQNNLKNLNWHMGDILNLPVKKYQAKAIFTPWLIDILPCDLRFTINKFSQYLDKGGLWINSGPLGFSQKNHELQYTSNEFKELLILNGFKIIDWNIDRIPYLQNPASGHWRNEEVLSFTVEKVKNTNELKKVSIHPNWLSDYNIPIPKLDSIVESSIQSKIKFEISSVIDGTRSINDIVKLLNEHYKMSDDLAKDALVAYLYPLSTY